MAEKIVSPGVFTKEIDQSFLPAAIADIGAAIIGPTVKGPALVPTVVTSYSEYQAIFGDVFRSGSGETQKYYTYLTSLAAKNYLKNSDKLTVVRILAGSYSGASANVLTGSNAGHLSYHTGSARPNLPENDNNTSFKLHTLADGEVMNNQPSMGTATATVVCHGDNDTNSTLTLVAFDGTTKTYTGAASDDFASNEFDASGTAAATATALSGAISHQAGHSGLINVEKSSATLTLTQGVAGQSGNTPITETMTTSGSTVSTAFTGGTGPTENNGLLLTGSKDNLKWEITSRNNSKGTFTLEIRRGNDTSKRKQILETWNNVSMDSQATNYIARVIGDSYQSIQNTGGNGDPYISYVGTYPPKSKYVRVEVIKEVSDYLDENGSIRDASATASLPALGSGSLGGSFTGGSDGTIQVTGIGDYTYENISENNSQGLDISNDGGSGGFNQYKDALDLLGNQDEYDLNLLMMPGAIGSIHSSITAKAIDICEKRGDCFVLLDPVPHGSSITQATDEAKTRDSSYAATYWPWVQVREQQLGTNVWVPPSVGAISAISFNDKVAHEWFAPAGLNRGTLDTVVQAERKLTQTNRDDLYAAGVNPIATFPGEGVTVYGQKTLQKKASALDRVNVRRLLIKVKKFIASSSRFLVFEQNNAATRRRFLQIANPFLEQIQSQSGLNAFRVVMDETNNTPDVVDRNILYGQIFVQPTKTAEFIVLDFTVQPSGATFEG